MNISLALMLLGSGPFEFNSGQWFVIVLTLIGCGTGVVIALAGIVAGVAKSMHRRQIEERLKQDMLAQGMAAEDIARVIEASAPEDALDRWLASRRDRR